MLTSDEVSGLWTVLECADVGTEALKNMSPEDVSINQKDPLGPLLPELRPGDRNERKAVGAGEWRSTERAFWIRGWGDIEIEILCSLEITSYGCAVRRL